MNLVIRGFESHQHPHVSRKGPDMGFEETSTEALLVVQGNLLQGLAVVAKYFEDGTAEISKKEGAAPPSQSGWLTLILLLEVEDELEARIRGFKRAVDPSWLAALVSDEKILDGAELTESLEQMKRGGGRVLRVKAL